MGSMSVDSLAVASRQESNPQRQLDRFDEGVLEDFDSSRDNEEAVDTTSSAPSIAKASDPLRRNLALAAASYNDTSQLSRSEDYDRDEFDDPESPAAGVDFQPDTTSFEYTMLQRKGVMGDDVDNEDVLLGTARLSQAGYLLQGLQFYAIVV